MKPCGADGINQIEGDVANVTKGKYAGVYTGRVIAKASATVLVPAGWAYKDRIPVNSNYLKAIHRCDGYAYS